MNGSITRKEPLVLIGIVAGAIIAGLEAAVIGEVLDVELGEELIRGVQVIVAIIGLLLGRRSVYSPARHDADVDEALRKPPPGE